MHIKSNKPKGDRIRNKVDYKTIAKIDYEDNLSTNSK